MIDCDLESSLLIALSDNKCSLEKVDLSGGGFAVPAAIEPLGALPVEQVRVLGVELPVTKAQKRAALGFAEK
jgi:hypothetical protein